MNREELPRIRLKVATNAGINILCTALRTWKVVEWLPHIEEAYREVKEDQEGDEDTKRRFIRALRIKKGNFYIANSELIGDIFEDNDEVQCEIAFPQPTSKKPKRERKTQKKKEKEGPNNQREDPEEVIEEDKEKEKPEIPKETESEPKSSKLPKKKQKSQEQPTPQKESKTKPPAKDKKDANETPIEVVKIQETPIETSHKSLKETLMKSIDFSKLRSILNSAKPTPKAPQPKERQAVPIVDSDSSDSDE